jgi:hypothetical protein
MSSEVLFATLAAGFQYMSYGVLVPKGTPMDRMLGDATALTLCCWNDSLIGIGFPSITEGQIRRWFSTICGVGFEVIQRTLDVAKNALLSSIEQGEYRLLSYERLKAHVKTEGGAPAVLSLLKPILASLTSLPERKDWSEVFRALYQSFSINLRVNPFLDESARKQRSPIWRPFVESYNKLYEDQLLAFACQQEAQLLAPAPLPSRIITRFWQAILSPIEYEAVKAPLSSVRFSPGATAECKRGTHELDKVVVWMKGYSPEAMQAIDFITGSDELSCQIQSNLLAMEDLSTPIAKLEAVPKSYKAFRLISKEPVRLVPLQQGMMKLLNLTIERSRIMRERYTASDGPERNRELAQFGSYDGKIATIDLSAASDSVTWSFVRSALSYLPKTQWLLSTVRSREIDIPILGRVELSSFGGMGNACTFPIEVLVFASIVWEAIALAGGSPAKTIWRIVGDDIEVDVRYAEAVIARLQYYKFKVNKDKSFLGRGSHVFRESCGMHALDGIDVTPYQLPRPFYRADWRIPTKYEVRTGSMRSSWPVQACAIANDLLYHQLRTTRKLVLRILRERLPQEFWPVASINGAGFHSYCATNFSLRILPSERSSFDRDGFKYWPVYDLNDRNTPIVVHGSLSVQYQYYWYSPLGRSVSVNRFPRSVQNSRALDRVYRHLWRDWELYWFLRASLEEDDEGWLPSGLNRETTTLLSDYDFSESGYQLGSMPALYWRSVRSPLPL